MGVGQNLPTADEDVACFGSRAALGQSVACLGVIGVESVGRERECEQHADLQGGEDVEVSLEALGERVGHLVERGLPLGEGRRLLRGCVLPQVVGHEDCALGVSVDELEQRVEGLAGVAAGFGEPLFDVGAERVGGEFTEGDGAACPNRGRSRSPKSWFISPGSEPANR